MDSIDPNVIIATLVLGALGWAYRKIRGGDKEEIGLRATLEAIIAAEVEELLADPARAAAARAELEAAAWKGLQVFGVKKSKLVELLVAELVNRGVAELRKRVNARAAAKLPTQLDELWSRVAKLEDAFKPDGSVPDLDSSMFDVTRVDAEPLP